MSKITLVAINTKYIHSNLAVFCLREAAKEYRSHILIKEYSINNRMEGILRDIFETQPDVLCFTCYIWNIEMIRGLLPELAKILPHVPVWLGGPEVTFQAKEYLERFSNLKGVVRGEGEIPFYEIVKAYEEMDQAGLEQIPGTTVKAGTEIVEHEDPKPLDFAHARLPYDLQGADKEVFQNRIIYYESSRGCPFSCSYCLSCIEKSLRFKNIDIVKGDLQVFLDAKVAQVKFVDRTFNCNREHSIAIWRYIKEHDNGITNFHFEIAADILSSEEILELRDMRPGLVQLEIGVQSTNEKTIQEIDRSMDFQKVKAHVLAINAWKNVHLHLDLIAGLPYEDFASFGNSFNQVYDLRPEQLQLGFLKLLFGSPMRKSKEEYGIQVIEAPPYEVLYTKWITYEEITRLKMLEHVLDMFYNSGMFHNALEFLLGFFESPFDLYCQLGVYYDQEYHNGELPSKNGKYELLHRFATRKLTEQEDTILFTELLRYDMFKRDNVKSLPECFESQDTHINHLGDRKLNRAEHIERFIYDVQAYEAHKAILRSQKDIYFDYQNRNPLDNNATIHPIL